MEFLSAFPNQFPYYELLLEGKLSAKTREWKWNHIGWTLFYTSKSRQVTHVMRVHNIKLDDFRNTLGCLVGVGYLLPVRANTQKEIRQIEREFNGRGPKEIFAGWARYEFKPFYRFDKAIPFSPPRGAVTTFKVPVELVRPELRKLNIQI